MLTTTTSYLQSVPNTPGRFGGGESERGSAEKAAAVLVDGFTDVDLAHGWSPEALSDQGTPSTKNKLPSEEACRIGLIAS